MKSKIPWIASSISIRPSMVKKGGTVTLSNTDPATEAVIDEAFRRKAEQKENLKKKRRGRDEYMTEEDKRKHLCHFSAEEEIKTQLSVQKKRYPQMNEEDIVKFVFQGMLGAGHLISSLPEATERLKVEMDGLEAPDDSDAEPLTEKISTDWIRLNLRPAKAQGMTAEDIAWYLVRSAERGALSFTRQNVYNFCVKAYNTDAMKAAAEKVLDDKYLPSHSEEYRAAYKPAYRVLYKDYKKFRKEEP